ncbi:malonyl-[acyl-carrier protein] O-methyltransferase BioC [Vibrio rumoiensis 1S-45]|uniref:Malonyl-[acyl-carrier protein] O-methyltransferase n=1 Tax=Vibrio rumoiensis 1S-45 TaxID=1188252 RepID=A0A1E5E4D0_9VIBR|nr:malonyl-[acyl-carrier protein] O-methyltransferase BioC [Vibrio rumoiensis 1S-45]
MEKNSSSANKTAIAQAFGKAAKTYDKHAAFQRDVGHRLIALLPKDLSACKVLDLGCGTGYFSQLLALRGAQVTAFDLSEAMLQQCQLRCKHLNVEYVQGDAEKLPFEGEQFDFVFSSLAIQWCDHLPALMSSLMAIVKPSGRIFFSTLLEGSLFELKDSWRQVDLHQHVNQFHHLEAINIALAQAGGQLHRADCMSITVWYQSALSLMKDLKGIGATHISGRSDRLTKRSDLNAVEIAYQQFKNHQGQLPATYEVCIGSIIK